MQTVSVIIPTRNRLEFLKAALASVYCQSYKAIEIIVIDEQSSDDTPAFLQQEYTEGKLRFIRNEEPKGAANARNIGIAAALGTFIAFLDDDDEWMPQKIEKQVALFADEEVGLVYTGIELVYEDMGFSYQSLPDISGRVFNQLLIENRIGVTSSVMIRGIVAKEFMFDVALPARQDYELWLRISRKWKVAGVREPLAKIYARNTLKRITSDIGNYERSIAYINEKYKDDIAVMGRKEQKARTADQYFFLASQAVKANNIVSARRYFLKSVKERFSLKSFVSFLASLAGVKAVLNLRRLKR